MAKNYPTWWKTACLELSENDKVMSRLIEVFNDKRLIIESVANNYLGKSNQPNLLKSVLND